MYRENKINPVTEINEDIKLDPFINAHFDNLNDTADYVLVLEDVTVNQLSILANSSKKYKVVRLK